ncbi:hypothetical protein CR513_34079, partial [Mucuna pruriens]
KIEKTLKDSSLWLYLVNFELTLKFLHGKLFKSLLPETYLVLNYIMEVEKIFHAMECTNAQKMTFGTYVLAEEAKH